MFLRHSCRNTGANAPLWGDFRQPFPKRLGGSSSLVGLHLRVVQTRVQIPLPPSFFFFLVKLFALAKRLVLYPSPPALFFFVFGQAFCVQKEWRGHLLLFYLYSNGSIRRIPGMVSKSVSADMISLISLSSIVAAWILSEAINSLEWDAAFRMMKKLMSSHAIG